MEMDGDVRCLRTGGQAEGNTLSVNTTLQNVDLNVP